MGVYYINLEFSYNTEIYEHIAYTDNNWWTRHGLRCICRLGASFAIYAKAVYNYMARYEKLIKNHNTFPKIIYINTTFTTFFLYFL